MKFKLLKPSTIKYEVKCDNMDFIAGVADDLFKEVRALHGISYTDDAIILEFDNKYDVDNAIGLFVLRVKALERMEDNG